MALDEMALGGKAPMRYIAGGEFIMGSDRFYREERPRRTERVAPFWIDTTPVTNQEFDRFVTATGYRTLAETTPDGGLPDGADPALAVSGSSVFTRPPPMSLEDPSQWWAYVPGADWRHPRGPNSDIEGLDAHPAVHIAYEDAEAYARWVGKALPTEAEWECAARGGLHGREYAWGDELAPGGAILANYWIGTFPFASVKGDHYRTTPVGLFPPNDYGLYDMIGNVWEWTCDWFGPVQHPRSGQSCCGLVSGARVEVRGNVGPHAATGNGCKVLKGGSHLCAENYCQRYRPAARHSQRTDETASHIGFRCVVRP